MLPLALAAALLLLGPGVIWSEPNPDWFLRCFPLALAAVVARELGRRLLGGAPGALFARRALFALVPLGAIGVIAADETVWLAKAELYFGVPLAVAWAVVWRPWVRREGVWLALAAAASFAAIWLTYADISPFDEVRFGGLPHGVANGLVMGAALGLLTLPALVWLARPADAGAWLENAILPRGGRRLALAGWLLLAATAAYAVGSHGLQNCRWLDLALKRSGCVAGLRMEGSNAQGMALSPDGSTLFVLDYRELHRIPLASFKIEQSVAVSDTFAIQQPVSVTDRLLAEQVAVTPDGSQVLVTASRTVEETYVLRYATAGMQPLPTVVFTDYLPFLPLAVSRDSERVSLARRQWRLADGAELEPLEPAELRGFTLRDMPYATDVSSPDSSMVAVASNGYVTVSETDANLRPAGELASFKVGEPDLGGGDMYIVFSADSSLIAVAVLESDGFGDNETLTVSVGEARTGRQLARFTLPDVSYGEPPMVFTPDNAALLIHNDGWLGRYRIR